MPIPARSSGKPALYLVDGSAYVYRAFFALPALTNSKGLPTNAIYGFTTMLVKIIRDHHPEGLAIVFDEKGPTHRHEEYKEYKAQRPPMPDNMSAQIPYIHRVVEAFGIPVVRLPGYEADDLIGTLARKAEGEGFDVAIVTSDKDMYQLLTPSVLIFDPVKDKWISEVECRAKFGVEPARVIDIMGLMGDSSDNIPGVKGIGEKTAAKLIAEFGTIPRLLERLDEVTPPKTRALLTDQTEQARLSRKLATIHVDAPIEFHPERFHTSPLSIEKITPLLRDLEFHSLLKSMAVAAPTHGSPEKTVAVLRERGDDQRFAQEIIDRGMVAMAGTLSEALAVQADMQGLGMNDGAGASVYLEGAPSRLAEPLKQLFAHVRVVKAAHDLKPLLLALGREGVACAPPYFDTMIAAYLLSPNRRGHELSTVALDILGEHVRGLRAEADTQRTDLFDVRPPPEAYQAGEAAHVVYKLVPVLKARLQEQGMLKLFEEVEMPLVSVLATVERNGFLLNVEALQGLSRELEGELARIMDTIATLADGVFNINSPKQLASVLFDKLGLKPIRKTKTGFSTDEETLVQLATQHELPSHILNYRGLSKLKSTYVDALPALVNPETGRLHTSLNQTVAATGRLSSADPNLQNIPVKGDHGLRIREAFIAPRGHLLLSADYSQIEPRILAHLAHDDKLRSVFERGEDIHMATAVEIFSQPPDRITKEMRRAAKTVVFGILYGISPFGLSQNLGITQAEAKSYIDAYFERYAGVKLFVDRTIAQARERGYTTTILGRRRPIPELTSSDPTQRGFGERMAVNSPIQGSAADLIKVAMIAVHGTLQEELPRTKMILQVHDELVFEVPLQDVESAKELVRYEMEQTGTRLGLSVPLKVDLGVGPNWRAAHP
ncbi:DNA polymerase [Nitrospira sp.]|nr:DNA polymerase [Nitrospira sp.]